MDNEQYIISTERLGLRRWRESDLHPFAAMCSDTEVMRYFPSTLSFNEAQAAMDRVSAHFDTNGFGLYAVEIKTTREFIGFTGFAIPGFESFFTPCVEIGWRYQKKAWGQGYATEAAKACLQFGFETLGFHRVLSFTASINVQSERVMQRIGMEKVGTFNHPNIDPQSALSLHVLYEVHKKL